MQCAVGLFPRSGNGNALVDSSSGVTLRTASGQISAPYMVLDAIVSDCPSPLRGVSLRLTWSDFPVHKLPWALDWKEEVGAVKQGAHT
jgi:hypothetical protein